MDSRLLSSPSEAIWLRFVTTKQPKGLNRQVLTATSADQLSGIVRVPVRILEKPNGSLGRQRALKPKKASLIQSSLSTPNTPITLSARLPVLLTPANKCWSSPLMEQRHTYCCIPRRNTATIAFARSSSTIASDGGIGEGKRYRLPRVLFMAVIMTTTHASHHLRFPKFVRLSNL